MLYWYGMDTRNTPERPGIGFRHAGPDPDSTIRTAAASMRKTGRCSLSVTIAPKLIPWLGVQHGSVVQLSTAMVDGRQVLILSALEPVAVR